MSVDDMANVLAVSGVAPEHLRAFDSNLWKFATRKRRDGEDPVAAARQIFAPFEIILPLFFGQLSIFAKLAARFYVTAQDLFMVAESLRRSGLSSPLAAMTL